MLKSKMLSGYNKRLFIYYFLTFAVFVVAVSMFQFRREKLYKLEQLNAVLNGYSQIVQKHLSINHDEVLHMPKVLQLFPDSLLRITIIREDGKVEYDSFVEDYASMENHAGRKEVIEASKLGIGKSIRFSTTAQKEYVYLARKYKHRYIRASLPYNLKTIEFLKADTYFIYFMVLVFVMGVIILIIISDRFGHSVRQLELFARRAGNNEEIDLNIHFPNNELGEIGQQIVQIYTSLKQAQNELSYEKEKLFKHLHISREGLAIFSKEKKEILANNFFIQYANVISDDQLIWSDEIFEIKEFEQINTFLKENINALFKSEFGVVQEQVKIAKNNSTFVVNCIIFSDKTFEISINDITESEERDKVKRQLTSNISHELKTPVSSIQGYIETLVNNKNLPEEKRMFFLQRSLIQSARLADLVKDISMLNKIEEAERIYDQDVLEVDKIAKNAIADVHLLLEEKGMRAETEFPDGLRIKGNHSLIYSIFRNLLDNSIAYAGENVQVHLECYKKDEQFFYIRYYDTGKGVSDEHLQRIFERFYRVDSGRARKYGGTGLGLSIVKNAVVLHGGHITVKNHKDGGLEFLFTLEHTKG